MPVLIIGKVFANWCGYCQQLKPEWNKLKKMSKAQIVEFEANQTQEKSDFENMHGIQLEVAGYPTIFKITPDKKVHYYGGPRRAIDIHKCLLRLLLQKHAEEKSRKASKRVIAVDDTLVHNFIIFMIKIYL